MLINMQCTIFLKHGLDTPKDTSVSSNVVQTVQTLKESVQNPVMLLICGIISNINECCFVTLFQSFARSTSLSTFQEFSCRSSENHPA